MPNEKMLNHPPKKFLDERGFTIVEMLIASLIGVIVLGATIYIFTLQEDVLNSENSSTDIRAKGRHAMKVLSKELKMAGFGLPTKESVTAISSTSISYRVNNDDVRTSTPPGASGTTITTAGDTVITVVNGSVFTDGDKIVIYNPSFGRAEYNIVDGTPTTTSIPLDTALINGYVASANAKLVTINKYNDVTLGLSGTTITKTVDSGSPVTLVGEVSNLSFDFYGVTETSLVKRVGVTINMQDSNDSSITFDYKSDVILRN